MHNHSMVTPIVVAQVVCIALLLPSLALSLTVVPHLPTSSTAQLEDVALATPAKPAPPPLSLGPPSKLAAGQLRRPQERRQQKQSPSSLVQASTSRGKMPKEADWFGDFDQMESTYTEEGLDANRNLIEYGFDKGYTLPVKFTTVKDSIFFHESPSAGAIDAWQTHYPAAPGEGQWQQTPEGWVEEYTPSSLTKKKGNPQRKSAEWFDSSVLNYDNFGRPPLPYPGTPRRLLEDDEQWVERAVNTTIQCQAIGCSASTSLNAFDAAVEEAQNCKLSISVHPTDFDNDWSKESIKSFTVNGRMLKPFCDPMARGCNDSAWRPLYPCITDFGVDEIISGGLLNVQGELGRMVDECPYNGYLLSGVVFVTCNVRAKTTTTTTTTIPLSLIIPMIIEANASLRCRDPGCTATTLITIIPDVAMLGGSCSMNISVAQTDFDDNLGVPEQVDFVELEGAGNLTADQQLGRNPCNEAYATGQPVTAENRSYSLITNYNVTELVLAKLGSLKLIGKISDHVDECDSNGYLLDGFVFVRCERLASLEA